MSSHFLITRKTISLFNETSLAIKNVSKPNTQTPAKKGNKFETFFFYSNTIS